MSGTQRFPADLRSQILKEWKENPDPAARKALAKKHGFHSSLINYWRGAGYDPGYVPTRGPRAPKNAAKHPPPPPMAPLKAGTKRWFAPDWKKQAVLYIDHAPSKQNAEAEISVTDTQYREWKRAYFPAPMGKPEKQASDAKSVRGRTPEEKRVLLAELERLKITEGSVKAACAKAGRHWTFYYELRSDLRKLDRSAANANGGKVDPRLGKTHAEIRGESEARAREVERLRATEGLSVKDACKRAGLSQSAYHGVLKRFAKGGELMPAPAKPGRAAKTADLVATANLALRHASTPGIQTEVGAAVKECLRRLRMLGIDLTSLNTTADGEKTITYTTTESFQL